MNRDSKHRLILDVVFLLLALCGLAINLLLLARRFSDTAAGIAGCGGGSCEEILASRWSLVLGIPVTVFGAMTYLALIVLPAAGYRRIHHGLLGVIAGAAGWFVFVQAVILKSFCPWCMAAHGLALAVIAVGVLRSAAMDRTFDGLKRIFPSLAAAFLGIGLAQVYGPVPAAHRIDGDAVASAPISVHSSESGRIAVFDEGRRSYQVAALPRLGRADATHILVEYFDYQCSACRKMAGYIDALVARHPAEIGVLLLPVPLERTCNPYASAGSQHPGSCEAARIALAVWRVKPEAFGEFHHALISGPSPEAARRLALEIMSGDRLEAALSDPWIEKRIQADVSEWHDFSKSTNKLPKLLIRDRRILHGLPSGEEDFMRVMEQELGL